MKWIFLFSQQGGDLERAPWMTRLISAIRPRRLAKAVRERETLAPGLICGHLSAQSFHMCRRSATMRSSTAIILSLSTKYFYTLILSYVMICRQSTASAICPSTLFAHRDTFKLASTPRLPVLPVVPVGRHSAKNENFGALPNVRKSLPKYFEPIFNHMSPINSEKQNTRGKLSIFLLPRIRWPYCAVFWLQYFLPHFTVRSLAKSILKKGLAANEYLTFFVFPTIPYWSAQKQKEICYVNQIGSLWFIANWWLSFYRTRVRSYWLCLSLTHSLTHSLPFRKLDWCDPGVWRCLLKTCWGCYCCWC